MTLESVRPRVGLGLTLRALASLGLTLGEGEAAAGDAAAKRNAMAASSAAESRRLPSPWLKDILAWGARAEPSPDT